MPTEPTKPEALAKIGEGLRKPPSLPSSYIVPVTSVSEDGSSAEVKLCTGGTLNIPISIVKKIVPMGHVKIGSAHSELVYAELDVTTEGGKVLQQTAHELMRLSRTLRAKSAPAQGSADSLQTGGRAVPLDTPLPATSSKLFFNGLAGYPQTITYTAPVGQYLASPPIISSYWNCYLVSANPVYVAHFTGGGAWEVVLIEMEWVVDYSSIAFGTAFTGDIVINFQLVQET